MSTVEKAERACPHLFSEDERDGEPGRARDTLTQIKSFFMGREIRHVPTQRHV